MWLFEIGTAQKGIFQGLHRLSVQGNFVPDRTLGTGLLLDRLCRRAPGRRDPNRRHKEPNQLGEPGCFIDNSQNAMSEVGGTARGRFFRGDWTVLN